MKNKMKISGIIAIAVIIGFSFTACPDGKTNNGNGNDDGDDVFFTSLSVQSKNIKSLYVSNLMVSDGGARAADSNLALSTLSYTTSLGQNAPVLFTNSSGKTYILEITDMKQIDDKRIAALHNGYYEVTITSGANVSYSISEKVDHYGSALIDMSSGRVYDFTEYHSIGDDKVYNSGIRFIENNIAYVIQGWPEAVIYKIDLTSASPQAVPLNSGTFTPMDWVRPSFTINNKVLTSYWLNDTYYGYSVDISGIIPPKPVKWAQLPASTFTSAGYTKETPVPMQIIYRWGGIPMKDLSGKIWYYTQYNVWEKDSEMVVDINFHHYGKSFYLLTELSIDDEGQYIANNVTTASINFEPANSNYDDYQFPGAGGDGVYLFFYINSAGAGVIQQDFPWSDDNRAAFLHNGIIMVNEKGFIKLSKRANGIDVESVSLEMPTIRKGRAVISKDNYLFWMDGTSIKRMDLKANATAETIYSNSNIINPPLRDWITSSGNNLIFYQYGSGGTVYTYSLDMYAGTQPVLLGTNDMDIKAIAELNF